MRTLNVVAGSPEWLEVRGQYNTASEASIMMGCGKVSRSELLRMKATGDKQEFSRFTQEVLFENGHKIEALARPIAEEILGEELFPVTGVCDNDYLLASFDGLTMDESCIWECKTMNASKAADVACGSIPNSDIWQVIQQLAVSGAEKALYMLSDGTRENTIYCWLKACDAQDDIQKLRDSWKQFDADLANYTHVETTPDPVGRAPDTLPALMVEVTGLVKASNLDAFKNHAMAVISGINRNLSTDVDFANAEKTVKWCGDVESKLVLTKQQVLAQMTDIDLVCRTIDQVQEEVRATRLELDKLVKARKEAIRGEILATAQSALRDHVQEVLSGFPAGVRLPEVKADFAGAMKGKKTVTSLKDATSTELARVKVELSRIATGIHASVKALHAEWTGFESLFSDWPTLVLKDAEDLRLLARARITEHKAEQQRKLDAEREQIRLEEEKKAQKKLDDEREEIARKAREEERKRNTEAMRQGQAEASEKQRIAEEANNQTPPPAAVAPVVERSATKPQPQTSTPTTTAAPSYGDVVRLLASHYSVDASTASTWLDQIIKQQRAA
jgi:predicted phage-related endonuclease